MYITLSGLPGSGKSTIARLLKAKLKWPAINAGAIFRSRAKKLGLTLDDYGARLARYPRQDRAIDEALIKFAAAHKQAIVEGRVAAWLAKRKRLPAVTVWLTAPLNVRAKRIAGRDAVSFNAAREAILTREKAERGRYKKLYGLDIRRRTLYDVVIRTDKHSPEEGVEKIIQEVKSKE